MTDIAKSWFFNRRPNGDITDETLVLREIALPSLSDGEIKIRSILLSLDATNRVWLSEWDIYMEPVNLGDPMRGFILGEVVESRNSDFPVGTIVSGLHSWSDYIVCDGAGFQPFPDFGLPLAESWGLLAVAGPTAYVGLLDIGRAVSGETVVVSAAAGAVGSVVGQIAKLQGCRVVGIAGGAEKCRWLVEELGFDDAIDYREGDLVEKLRAAVPNGIDVLFENVGGDILDAGLTLMNDFGRVVVCGLISTYNQTGVVPGPTMFRNVIMRRLTIQGFVILDHVDRFSEAMHACARWLVEDKIIFRIHLVDGLEHAAKALNLLYTGGNSGKLMVRIGPDLP